MSQDLVANYKRAFGNRLGVGEHPALILVDFVVAYFDESCELYADVEKELASALRIRNFARRAGLPIIYTRVEYQRDGINGGTFFKKILPLRHFVSGSKFTAWAPGLDPMEHELVISKQYASAFFGTSLSSFLTVQHIDTLIITGLTTSGCVRATCVDAISHGLIPIVVADACGDRHQSPHEASLFDMNSKYGDVLSEQEVMGFLSAYYSKQISG